ncbi:Molybdate transporter 1 [Choanephora cucurbitarum]|uniref:Molybdate transporter 1 n=1 Tax=Choanephora cucurbitarum TaxID=101091 RepID=A0A1C7N3U7_9FUNG|nr:Molybdate transporter 1 [Choanephora cucurbitarum]
MTTYFQHLRKHFTLHEISGSLGDLGTLLPIMISLGISGQIDLTSTLWFTGIWNILSGFLFRVPVCVQPMKAIAAVVLAKNMTIQENMAAGLSVGMLVFFLGITRTIHLVGTFTPAAVIKGKFHTSCLQLGTAIQLIIKAHKLVPDLKWEIDASNWADNNVWILLSFIFVVACYRTKIPSALILFIVGLIFALILMFVVHANKNLPRPSVVGGHYPHTVIVPSPEEFRNGFLNAGLGQLPLTSLNSVIALCALIDELFPQRHATTSHVAVSVGLMNLIGCWFGAMPVCHGSGGLAGQYRFGARSEVSVIFLGCCKLLLGILFGSSLVGLLKLFPTSILAVMLFISGVELGCAARSLNDNIVDESIKRENFVIMLLTTGSLVAYSNDGIGFVAGLASACLLSIQRLGFVGWANSTWAATQSIPRVWKYQGPQLPVTMPQHHEETIPVSDPTTSKIVAYNSADNTNK